MSNWGCPVLTYHGQNVFANEYGRNDHLSLAEDLQAIQEVGLQVVPLARLVAVILGREPPSVVDRAVCITFDDGCKAEVSDLEFPQYGIQPGFERLLRDFRQRYPQRQSQASATTFVIADEQTRQAIDQQALFGQDWMTASWWPLAQARGIIDIQNHGWDHKHPTADDGIDPGLHARFETVTTFEECELQVAQAARRIADLAQRHPPRLFAYPYGRASDFIRAEYFPSRGIELGMEAAFSTIPGHCTAQSDRWSLPRYVCGRDWKTPARFASILANRWHADG